MFFVRRCKRQRDFYRLDGFCKQADQTIIIRYQETFRISLAEFVYPTLIFRQRSLVLIARFFASHHQEIAELRSKCRIPRFDPLQSAREPHNGSRRQIILSYVSPPKILLLLVNTLYLQVCHRHISLQALFDKRLCRERTGAHTKPRLAAHFVCAFRSENITARPGAHTKP